MILAQNEMLDGKIDLTGNMKDPNIECVYIDGQKVWPPKYSLGLEYSYNGDTNSWGVSGLGTCTDSDIVIPEQHVGLNGNTMYAASVTTINNEAFDARKCSKCNDLTSVVIPDSVTSIGASAFYNCSNLTSIKIGDNVTSVGDYAFYGCSNLKSVAIPDEVTNIGEWAFYGCTKLKSVLIGKNVGSIGYASFAYCTSLVSINFTENSQLTALPDSFAIGCSSLKFINLDCLTALTTIKAQAFQTCTSLTSLKIPSTVKTFGFQKAKDQPTFYGPFFGCTDLTSITIPFIGLGLQKNGTGNEEQNVTGNEEQNVFGAIFGYSQTEGDPFNTKVELSTGIYYYSIPTKLSSVIITNALDIPKCSFCNCTSLTSIEFPAIDTTNTIRGIGWKAFSNCTSLKTFTLPDLSPEGGYISDSAFLGCTGLQSINFNSSLTSIGASSFQDCSSLSTIEIPDSVTSIGRGAFGGCLLIEKINFNATNCADLSEDNYVFHKAGQSGEGITVTFGDNVKHIPAYLYYSNSEPELGSDAPNITSVVFGHSVTSIGGWAFAYCRSLTSVVIGDSVTSIGDNAFKNCTSLTNVVIPDSVTSIGDSAFNNCNSLTSVVISDNVTSIGDWVFYDCNSLASVVIPNSVTSIGERAFASCDKLTSVKIPDSVTRIGDSAFSGCSNLTSVVIGDSVTSIGNSAFYYCNNLTSVVIGDNVTSIGSGAFNYCFSLTSVYYKGSSSDWSGISISPGNSYLRNITPYYYSEDPPSTSDNYWHYVDGVPSIWILGNDTILNFTFSTYAACYWVAGRNDSKILQGTTLAIPSTYDGPNGEHPVMGISARAFRFCDNLTSVVISNNVTSIGEEAFFRCSNLKSVVIGNSITTINNKTFQECGSLTSVVIGDNVTFINEDAFDGCDSLTKVNYLGTIDEWVNISFGNAYANPLRYAKNLYINNELVTTANITTATKINDYAFYNCGLTSVEIGDSVTSIGSWAFGGCPNLTSIKIGDSVTNISVHAFNSCYKLTSIVIPNSVTSIGDYAFLNCYKLVAVINKSPSITVGEDLTENGYLFYYALAIFNNTGDYEAKFTNENGYLIYNNDDEKVLCAYQGTETDSIIPDNITDVYTYAFYDCDSLTNIYYAGTPEEWDSIIPEEGIGLDSVNVYFYTSPYGPVDGLLDSTNTYFGWYMDNGVPKLWETLPNNFNVLSYTVNSSDHTCAVSGLTGALSAGTQLPIPSAYYDGERLYSVTSIGEEAFYNRIILTSITIPNSVTSIGERAFSGCHRLVEVINKSPYITVKKGSYSNGYLGCYALKVFNSAEPYVNKFTTDNGFVIYNADDGKKVLCRYEGTETELTLPAYVESINQHAFDSCYSLTSVIIPDSVTSIGEDAFEDCIYLTSVVIPDSVTYIGGGAFYNCGELTSVVIPNSVTSLGGYVFSSCSKLTSAVIGDNVTSIGIGAFRYCDSLTSAVIPDSVTIISDDAFLNCSGLTEVKYLGTIDKWASISFGNTSANPMCHAKNKNLYINNELVSTANITTATKINDYAFYFCTNLTSMIIGDSVTSIGEDAFAGCVNLASVVIGKGVTKIGENAFGDCNSLTSVYYKGSLKDEDEDGVWEDDWEKITIKDYNTPLTNATRYYYSESQPTNSEYNYWCFMDEKPAIWRTNSQEGEV